MPTRCRRTPLGSVANGVANLFDSILRSHLHWDGFLTGGIGLLSCPIHSRLRSRCWLLPSTTKPKLCSHSLADNLIQDGSQSSEIVGETKRSLSGIWMIVLKRFSVANMWQT